MNIQHLQEAGRLGFRVGFISGMCAMGTVALLFVSWWCAALFAAASGVLAWVSTGIGSYMVKSIGRGYASNTGLQGCERSEHTLQGVVGASDSSAEKS